MLNRLLIFAFLIVSCSQNRSKRLFIYLDQSLISADSLVIKFDDNAERVVFTSPLQEEYSISLPTLSTISLRAELKQAGRSWQLNSLLSTNNSDTLLFRLLLKNNTLQLAPGKRNNKRYIFSTLDKSLVYDGGIITERYPFAIKGVQNKSQVIYTNYSGDQIIVYDLRDDKEINRINLPDMYRATVSTIVYSSFYNCYIFDIQTTKTGGLNHLVIIDQFGNYSIIKSARYHISFPNCLKDDKWIYYVKSPGDYKPAEIRRITPDQSEDEFVFADGSYIYNMITENEQLIILKNRQYNPEPNWSVLRFDPYKQKTIRADSLSEYRPSMISYLDSTTILLSNFDLGNPDKGVFKISLSTKKSKKIFDEDVRFFSLY
ncbi:MAG: hypothetical protein KDD94_04875 [Calditrichaeota bacterium]|nr:hypothetical protein [Calditrichota bacterium]